MGQWFLLIDKVGNMTGQFGTLYTIRAPDCLAFKSVNKPKTAGYLIFNTLFTEKFYCEQIP